MKRCAILVLCLLSFGLAPSGFGIDEKAAAVIERARAYLGSEEALTGVHTLHFDGELELFDQAISGDVDIFLMKPSLQRMEVENAQVRRVSGVDEIEGWEIIEDKRPEKPEPEVRSLTAGEYLRNYYTALENLYFHDGWKMGKATVTYEGRRVLEGIEVDEIHVNYHPDHQFVRFFEMETGRLIGSRNPDGSETREREWVVQDGIRFPSVIEYYRDEKRVTRLIVSKVEVNPSLDPGMFRYPIF